MRYTAVLLTFSSVAFAAPMESGATIAIRQQSGGILSGITNLLGNPGGQRPANGTTGGILSGILGNPSSLLPGAGTQNAPNNGGILSGFTRLLGNPGGSTAGGQVAPSNGSAGGAVPGLTSILGGPAAGQQPAGGLMSGFTSLLSNLGSHLPGSGDQYPPNSGGTGGVMADLQVLPDHMKFVTIPTSANQPIPKEQNSQLREGHRIVHVAINKSAGLGGANKST
ncbi:hypothetical protein MY5147_007496 [Beauveria neobassiana]|uniref:Uncharacterized protein n=2 Tax=Beauveria bassiana TaxID=176275 RepID=A0A0A2W089_BEABA|nr:hypothetical protein BBAD15_g8284 [Beauveria bassiana D1-5]PQK17614.1 hypothetical protein BB8028_0008g01230 [Beauveria bassiana]